MISSENHTLFYSYLTNTSQAIDFKIWSNSTQQWYALETSDFDSFSQLLFQLNSSYYDNNYEVKLRFYGNNLNTNGDFELNLNELRAYYEKHISYNSSVGQFSPVENTNNKFTYNWSGIQNFFAGYYNTGDEVNITVQLVDTDTGLTRNITDPCILDFEAPQIDITIGDGLTNYSESNYAAPWTPYVVEFTDNTQGILNHDDYYYDDLITQEYQTKVYDINDTLVYESGFRTINNNGTLYDLGIPHDLYTNKDEYYNILEFKATDSAGNVQITSNYLGQTSKILVSNELTIQWQNGMDTIDVNELYDGISQILNFTLTGPDNSELKNKLVDLISSNYNFKTPIWDANSQTYIVNITNIYDLILYSENIFDNYLTSNYINDNKLNWDAEGDGYYAFAKHASQEVPLVLTYNLQEEKIAYMDISERAQFRLSDHTNTKEIYAYL